MLVHLSIIGCLFLLSGFFSSTETALFSLGHIEKKRLREKYPKFAGWVMTHLEKPRRTLITILIGNLIVNTLAAAMATLFAIRYLGLEYLGIAMVVFTLALILIGEIIPKVVAVYQSELLSLIVSTPLRLFEIVLTPLRWIVQWITDRCLSLITHESTEATESVTAEELQTLVKIGEEEGVLEPQERHMIQKLFGLGERPVKDIMIPRTDVIGLDIDDANEKHKELIQKYHFRLFPVYQENMDHVLGIISVQEYMLNQTRELRDLLKQPLFIPESKRIDEVLEIFKKHQIGFAVCVDEYGGTAGIVTQEDVLEEIFGEYYDEYEEVENPIRRYSHQEFLVNAKINLSDFNEYFSSQLQSEEASTLGGLILEKLGEVPKKGKTLETEQFDMRIHDVIRHRIHLVLVRPKR